MELKMHGLATLGPVEVEDETYNWRGGQYDKWGYWKEDSKGKGNNKSAPYDTAKQDVPDDQQAGDDHAHFGTSVSTQGEDGPAPVYNKRPAQHCEQDRRTWSRDEPFVISHKGRRVSEADRQFECAVFEELAKNEEELTTQDYVTSCAVLNPPNNYANWLLSKRRKGILSDQDEERITKE